MEIKYTVHERNQSILADCVSRLVDTNVTDFDYSEF